ncbi:hypothetical protein OXX59_001451 [Metschnikowia pulcherrima]
MSENNSTGEDRSLSTDSSSITLPLSGSSLDRSLSHSDKDSFSRHLADQKSSKADKVVENPRGASEDETDEKQCLINARAAWKAMLNVSPQDGDATYLVPSSYLERVFSLESASSISDLASVLGKLDSSSLVDAHGALPDEELDSTPFTQISPELFHQLVSVFGIQGDPVIRNIVVRSDGTAALERSPPFFVIHTLSESSHAPKYHNNFCRADQSSKCCFSLSQTKTFHHLIDAIKTCMFKAKNTDIRVWFVKSNDEDELPPTVPLSMFFENIDEKKLISPLIMETTLRSQGITSSVFHVVAETFNRTTKKFPIDLAVENMNSSELEASKIFHSGGNLGLSNLGNTCYMNSALQCLVHLSEVNLYFFFDLHERELNRSNPLGNKGEVAIAFSSLLHKLFDTNTSNSSSVAPREFKYTIGRYSSMFHGYQQQDSQEFLSWLLDALHEDLNRIYDKPYLEKPELNDGDVNNSSAISELAAKCWAQHKQRNDSIIVDLFTGLYQSTLICPDCSKQSISFDPFNDMTLPLPVNKKWYHTFTIVDLSPSSVRAPISELEVELPKASCMDDLIKYLSDFLHVPASQLFLFEIFRNYFYKDFQGNGTANKFLPVSELISDDDIIIVYIIPHDPSLDWIVPVINVVPDEDKSYNTSEPFGLPLFVVLDRRTEASSFGTIRTKLEQAVKILSDSDIEERFTALKGGSSKTTFTAKDFPLIKASAEREDSVMVDANESGENMETDGYDSDISLANPNISASLGFVIRISEEATITSSSSQSSEYRSNSKIQTSRGLQVPLRRPQLNNLPSLAEKLHEKKRNYYHYPELAEKVLPGEGLVGADEEAEKFENAPENRLSDSDIHSFVVVNKDALLREEQADDCKNIDVDTMPNMLEDEDMESDTNWDNVNSLLASIDNLGDSPKVTSDVDADNTSGFNADVLGKGMTKHPMLVSEKSLLVLEWDPLIFAQFFGNNEQQAWKNPVSIPNPSLEASRHLWNQQQKSTISLYDCLKNFSTPEILGEQDLWYCPRCKDHKRATKTIQLWSTGDLLTIHLKRFQSARHFSDKIDMVVDFPIEGLDMKDYVSSSNGESLIYDLVAVDEHYGGLGGGHYTSSAKTFRDGKWYKFNDARVTVISDPQDCVTGAAYLLFYKKRTPSTYAGGSGVETLLKDGQTTFEVRMDKLRNSSRQVLQEVEAYNQALAVESDDEVSDRDDQSIIGSRDSDDQSVIGRRDSVEDEDLYADSDANEQPETPSIERSGSNKKLRSPSTEQSMKFGYENQRKQRLLSKGSDSPRSVNINMGVMSSVSKVTSPSESFRDIDTEDLNS